MTHDDLARALDTVHEELGGADHLDAAEVERLRETMRQIQHALEAQTTEHASLSERVSESAKHFEESHPRLTGTLGRIADMLQQMGI